jgi:hypothetical protein
MIGYWLYSWAPFLIIAAIFVWIAYRAYAKRLQEKQQLKRIAILFGFTFSDGEATETAPPPVSGQTAENGGFLRTISGWHMKGRYNGVETKIYSKKISSGKHSVEHTLIDASTKWNSSSSLVITRETTLGRLGKAIFDMQDIKTGHEELDRRLIIKGVPEQFVKRIMQDANLQQELLSLFEIEGSIYVDRNGAHFQTKGTLVDEQQYRKLLDHLTRTASALEHASSS